LGKQEECMIVELNGELTKKRSGNPWINFKILHTNTHNTQQEYRPNYRYYGYDISSRVVSPRDTYVVYGS